LLDALPAALKQEVSKLIETTKAKEKQLIKEKEECEKLSK